MIIKFRWRTGCGEFNADAVIEHMTLSSYRKWVKLFAKCGEHEQHKEFLNRLQIHINCEDNKTKLKTYQRKFEILKGLVS